MAGTGGTGSAGTANTPGGEGGGPPDGPISEELTLCDRLTKLTENSRLTTLAFEKLAYADCRIKWLNRLYIDEHERDTYLNDLIPWNLQFWGCQSSPVDDFPLVWGTPAISQGDADIVIDHYLEAATEQLQLTKNEQGEMRAALERLATTIVVSESTQPSQPACDAPNTGGAGGMDGGGGIDGLGGANGTAGADSAGQGGVAGSPAAAGGIGGAP